MASIAHDSRGQGADAPSAPQAAQPDLSHIADALRSLAVEISQLVPDPANARKHDERNIAAIKSSLSRFGQRIPIVVQKQGMVVRAGNGRLQAAKLLGWTHIAAVIVDEASIDATAYAIADNRTAELATWDDETLASLLQSLPDDARLAAGYDDGELKELLDGLTPPEVVEDEAPAPLPTPVSKTGDLWVLGGHRLLCGDSTKAEDVGAVLAGEKAAMVFTDPPYNINYGNIKHEKFKQRSIANDSMGDADWRTFCERVVESIALATDGCVYVCHAPSPDGRVMASVLDAELHCSTTIVWNKDQFTLGRGKYQNKHEPIWFGWVKDGSRFTDSRTLTNVWDVPRPKSSEEHPTMKPPSLCATAIGHASNPSDVVFEPFSGSGTTIVAAEQLGRRCFAIEIEPLYVDVAVRRWQKLTGKDAVLESTGKTWRETAAERGVAVE